MKVKIIGIQKIDYTNKQGRHISGVNLHSAYEDTKVTGLAVDKFYLPDDFPNVEKLQVNDTVSVYFNQYGKVDFLALDK